MSLTVRSGVAIQFDIRPPSAKSVLRLLQKARLVEISRELGVVVKSSATKEDQVNALARKKNLAFRELLRALGRDELKSACRAHGLDERGRSREELANRIPGACQAANDSHAPSSVPAFRLFPLAGDIVVVRQRQYLVTEVLPRARDDRPARVSG